jgi:hypothetical protein
MRSYFAAIGFAFLALSAPIRADVVESDDTTITEELADPGLEQSERIGLWNQWVCYAYTYGHYQPFAGSSFYFRPGSGQGQQARDMARINALRSCVYYTRQFCQSDIQRDCFVLR